MFVAPPAPIQPRMAGPQPAQRQPARPAPAHLHATPPVAHHQRVAQPGGVPPASGSGVPPVNAPRHGQDARATGPVVQRIGNGEAFQLPSNLSNFGGGGGQPLPNPVRQKMESFFNTSFADVRVHVGAQASSIGALAFTHGSNLYFAPGQYNPSTAQGQQLLGHELTHVMQQRAGRVRNPFGSGVAVVQDHNMEAEADRMGLRAASHQVTAQAKRTALVPSAPPGARRSSPPVMSKLAPSPGGAQATVQRSSPLNISGMMAVGNGSYRIVAGVGEQQVGSVMLHNNGKTSIEVTDLAVDPSHRKQGLGGVLMASAMRAGLQLGKTNVTLASQDSGTGRLTAWYKNMGFSAVGSNNLGYPMLEAPISRALSGVAQGRMRVSHAELQSQTTKRAPSPFYSPPTPTSKGTHPTRPSGSVQRMRSSSTGGGYGYGFNPYVYYAPPVPPTTTDLENAVQQGNDNRLQINRFGGYAAWYTRRFPGFNVEFNLNYRDANNQVWQMVVHVKYNNRNWWEDQPYAMSLKFANNTTLENPTTTYHPGLFTILAGEARQVIANQIAWNLMTQTYNSQRVTLAIINHLINTNNRSGLAALAKSAHFPLSAWDQDAWSRFLDWNTT